MKVDLHMHSTASDGQYKPAQLVKLAKERGVEVMALTDHDTIDGLKEAMKAGEESDICVIPGVELSAAEFDNLHILGYGFDVNSQRLNHLCEEVRKERERHTEYITSFLCNRGVEIDLAEVKTLAGNGAIGRPHFARVMVRHGYVASNREAFERYLDTEEYHKIKRKKPSAQTCIATICAAGGQPILAHPYQLYLDNMSLETQIKHLKACGLAGLECYYPKHTSKQREYYLRLAEKYQLYTTAGSDFHGERVHQEDQIVPTELDINWLLCGRGGVQAE